MNPATASSMLVLVFSLVVIAAGAESLEKPSYNLSLIEKAEEELAPVVGATMEIRDIGAVIERWKLGGHVKTCAPCDSDHRDTKKRLMDMPCCFEIRCFTPPLGPVFCTAAAIACNCDNCDY